jgi:hypothetical protein
MSELKVKQIGKAGFMICIGADGTNGEWYFMTPGVKAFVDANVKEGDSVEIKNEKTDKKNSLIYIAKVGGGNSGTSVPTPVSTGGEKPKWTPKASGSGFQRSPADNESIKRQAIGHMTSRILSGMMTSGIATLEQVEGEMERIYKKFVTLVG